MNATQKLQDLGQSVWLDNITRDLLNSGTLSHYIGVLARFVNAGIDIASLAARLQDEGPNHS